VNSPGLRSLLRGTRVLLPEAARELPRLADQAAALRQRLAVAQIERFSQLDAAVQAARDNGWRAGHADALRELHDVRARVAAWTRDADGALQDLLLHALRRLLGALPADVPVALLVQRALHEAGAEQGAMRACVHPSLRDAVAARLRDAGIEHPVHADESCAPSACRVDTAFGSLHADLDTQLAALADALDAQGDTR
jgi:flagellar biosynthesis/type III secretory pathway protein FliH